jgi:hypothetical protein
LNVNVAFTSILAYYAAMLSPLVSNPPSWHSVPLWMFIYCINRPT